MAARAAARPTFAPSSSACLACFRAAEAPAWRGRATPARVQTEVWDCAHAVMLAGLECQPDDNCFTLQLLPTLTAISD